MLVDRCCDHLPFKVIKKIHKKDWAKITSSAIEDELQDEQGAYHCYLDAFALTDARIPQLEDEQLSELARSRFAPLIEGWIHE